MIGATTVAPAPSVKQRTTAVKKKNQGMVVPKKRRQQRWWSLLAVMPPTLAMPTMYSPTRYEISLNDLSFGNFDCEYVDFTSCSSNLNEMPNSFLNLLNGNAVSLDRAPLGEFEPEWMRLMARWVMVRRWRR
jgi:hypothetical protein